MNVLVGPYYVQRERAKDWSVRYGRNGIVVELGLTKQAAAALCHRLNANA